MARLRLLPVEDEHAVDSPGERAEFARAEHRPGLELYRASLREHRFEPHAHAGFGVGVIEAGAERFRYRGGEHVAGPGALILMNPEEVHTGRAADADGWRYRMVYVDPHAMAEFTGRTTLWFPEVVRHDAALAARLSQTLRAAWEASEPLGFDCALGAVLEAVAERHGRGDPAPAASRHGLDDRRLQRVVEHVDAHLAEPLDLRGLAAAAGLSPFHFARSFRQRTGVTPMAWTRVRRGLRATALLSAGASPAEAAARAGFADQAHLTRWLRATHGTTPGRYRAATRRVRAA